MTHSKKNSPLSNKPVTPYPKIVLSASRRTDIPAFYGQWLTDQLAKGRVYRINPFNRRKRRFAATPESVHSIVLWSKNFGPMIQGNLLERLRDRGYHLFFNFTVNSPSPVLEPHLPALDQRLKQMAHLAGRFGPDTINWRFDPICEFRQAAGAREHNRSHFKSIAQQAGDMGIHTCITSFVDLYPKVVRRAGHRNLSFEPVSATRQIQILEEMATLIQPLGIRLKTCCESTLLNRTKGQSTVTGARCISAQRLTALFGPGMDPRPDKGQRRQQGCGCCRSIDIGDYRQHPCSHNCLFCYANPLSPTSQTLAGPKTTSAAGGP